MQLSCHTSRKVGRVRMIFKADDFLMLPPLPPPFKKIIRHQAAYDIH